MRVFDALAASNATRWPDAEPWHTGYEVSAWVVARKAATGNEVWPRHKGTAREHVTHEMRYDKHVKETSKQMNSLVAEQVPPSFSFLPFSTVAFALRCAFDRFTQRNTTTST